MIFAKPNSFTSHKERIDTKNYFILRLLTLVGPNNLVAMAACQIISAKFLLDNIFTPKLPPDKS